MPLYLIDLMSEENYYFMTMFTKLDKDLCKYFCQDLEPSNIDKKAVKSYHIKGIGLREQ